MVFAMFGRKSKAKVVRDGRRERRRCPLCGATTDFLECKVDKTYTAYLVVTLWNSQSTAFVCSECQEVMDLDATDAPELTARERAQLDKVQAKEEKVRVKQALAAAKNAERAAEQQEVALDDELAAMKSRLGID